MKPTKRISDHHKRLIECRKDGSPVKHKTPGCVYDGVDVSKRFAVYLTSHPSGFYYKGKGLTERILSGNYKGSGIRLHLAFYLEEFAWHTWETTIVDTFDDEEDAYKAEALFLPKQEICNPFCLNMKEGGRTRRGASAGDILRQKRNAEKRARTEAKKAQAREEKARARERKKQQEEADKAARKLKPHALKGRKAHPNLVAAARRPKSESFKRMVSERFSKPISEDEVKAFEYAMTDPAYWRGNVSVLGTARKHNLPHKRLIKFLSKGK